MFGDIEVVIEGQFGKDDGKGISTLVGVGLNGFVCFNYIYFER